MNELSNNLQVTGQVTLRLYKPDGQIIERQVKNLVVQAGLEFITSRMTSATKNVMSHMGIGTSTISPVLSQTALLAQVGSRSPVSATVLSNNITFTSTFLSGVGTITGAITEAGIFNAATGGDMLCRTTFPAINKTTNDTLSISWVVTVGQLG